MKNITIDKNTRDLLEGILLLAIREFIQNKNIDKSKALVAYYLELLQSAELENNASPNLLKFKRAA